MIMFALSNTLLPVIAVLILQFSDLPLFATSIGVAAMLLAINICFFKILSLHRLTVACVIILNMLALILFGEISFFTAIPNLLNYLPDTVRF